MAQRFYVRRLVGTPLRSMGTRFPPAQFFARLFSGACVTTTIRTRYARNRPPSICAASCDVVRPLATSLFLLLDRHPLVHQRSSCERRRSPGPCPAATAGAPRLLDPYRKDTDFTLLLITGVLFALS